MEEEEKKSEEPIVTGDDVSDGNDKAYVDDETDL